MFAQTDIFSLDKWVMVGKDLGIGTMFALVLLALFAFGSFYVVREGFAAAAESREFHKQQAATCQAMLKSHTDPAGPCNLTAIRAAAAHGLDAIEEIGQQVGADVTKHVEAAKNRLVQ